MLPTIAEDRLLAAIYWLGAFCTLGILTILYAENRLYRLLEHFFIGLAVGYGLFIAIRDVLEPVWWRAMMTESSGVIANFDKSPNLKGVVLDRTIKREGDGAWRWSPQESPRLLLTKVPTDWGAPNYLRLWLRSDKIVPDGMLTFRIRLRNPDTQKEASLTTQLPTNFVGWRDFCWTYAAIFTSRVNPIGVLKKSGAIASLVASPPWNLLRTLLSSKRASSSTWTIGATASVIAGGGRSPLFGACSFTPSLSRVLLG